MFKEYPTTVEMKHYTAEEFGERMDEILDSITKEDTAYIIDTDKNKNLSGRTGFLSYVSQRALEFLSFIAVDPVSQLPAAVTVISGNHDVFILLSIWYTGSTPCCRSRRAHNRR